MSDDFDPQKTMYPPGYVREEILTPGQVTDYGTEATLSSMDRKLNSRIIRLALTCIALRRELQEGVNLIAEGIGHVEALEKENRRLAAALQNLPGSLSGECGCKVFAARALAEMEGER